MLRIFNLHLLKEENPILNGVSMELTKDSMYVLLGPNGSGKSTLAQIIAGNITESEEEEVKISGDIFFENRNLLDLSSTERSLQGIFLAHQSPPEIGGLNIFSFLRSIYSKHKNASLSLTQFDKLLNEKMDLLKLPENTRSRYFNENFSGGERKKMEMLQILLLEPKLIILDEIDSGVDIDSQKILLDALKNYQATTKATMLFITHNLTLAEKIPSDEIFIMRSGKIVANSKTSEEKIHLLELLNKKGYDEF